VTDWLPIIYAKIWSSIYNFIIHMLARRGTHSRAAHQGPRGGATGGEASDPVVSSRQRGNSPSGTPSSRPTPPPLKYRRPSSTQPFGIPDLRQLTIYYFADTRWRLEDRTRSLGSAASSVQNRLKDDCFVVRDWVDSVRNRRTKVMNGTNRIGHK